MKFSLLALALLPAAYAIPTSPNVENKKVTEAASKLAKDVLMNTEDLAHMKVSSSEDSVTMPGVTFRTDSSKKVTESRDLSNYELAIQVLVQNLVSDLSQILSDSGHEESARQVQT